MSLCTIVLLALSSFGGAAYLDRKQVSTDLSTGTSVPQYFQTAPEIYAGPTATGAAPFLAATNPAPFGATGSFVANAPLETALPIVGDTQNASIFHLMGQLSPYFPNPELFDSGVLHYYNYGHLYNTSTKIIARTTTQDRMLKSAEYFMAGFFGLEWTNNATLELIIEEQGFNNSLAGYFQCNNSNKAVNQGGTNASMVWENIYLQNATKRLQAFSPNFKLNVSDVYNMQTLCPYETVAFGYSAFCDLFTYEEWRGFEYSIDLSFAGNNYFQSPTGRAVGIGYVQEILARLQHHVFTTTGTQANITLDNNTQTFPLNQTLYFDFSHDTNMAAILTAFGLAQFAPVLPSSGPIPSNQQLIVSHLQPFGARVDIEVIPSPKPISATRLASTTDVYESGAPTTYIHFIINQRTLPLGASFPACGNRTDGWCELQTFLRVQNNSLAEARYEYACNGKYDAVPYGELTNGVPQPSSTGS
ncbi:MAG: hypothetical protein L6R39_002912 [Caloplaca ligustica]|nr:MAG: hypothetical protein L6R39_002912 [Caloplaca ligustica]